MTLQELDTALKERFPDAGIEYCEGTVGDPALKVAASSLHDVCRVLKDSDEFAFDYLRLLTGADRGDCYSSVYHLYSYTHFHEAVLRVDLDKEQPVVRSVSDIWPAADWLERESFDMMGIVYEGHPNLQRILLPLDWQGYPLRKDYQDPDSYHGIAND